jgi:uncharacterized membrane protein
MASDNFLFSLLGQLMWTVPTLLVCIIGIVMLRTRATSNKAKNFGSAGLALVALGALVGVAFSSFMSSGGIDYSSSNFRFFQMGYSAIMQILHVVSLVFLVIAICSKEKLPAPDNQTRNPYS